MSLSKIRTNLLTIAGGSTPVLTWVRWRCDSGVSIQRINGVLEVRTKGRTVRVAPKHAFFLPEVCSHFEVFAHALPADANGVVDFAVDPAAFNMCRQCMRLGVNVEHHGEQVWLRTDNRVMVLALKHFVYAADLASKFDLYTDPLVPEVRQGVEFWDYSVPGRLQTYRKSGLQFEMASFPEEEEAIEEYFKWYRPKRGDLVFDMGAHCGVSTYAFSQLVGLEGKVVAFEPDPTNFAILRRNLERHGLTNVIAVNIAIAGTAGQLGFNSEGTIGSALVSLLRRESVGSIVQVEAITMADAFVRWGKPAFCKIDIEGAEIDVLAKSSNLLREQKTNFALDTNHPKADGQMTNGDVEAIFRSCDYEVISEANPLFTTWAKPKA